MTNNVLDAVTEVTAIRDRLKEMASVPTQAGGEEDGTTQREPSLPAIIARSADWSHDDVKDMICACCRLTHAFNNVRIRSRQRLSPGHEENEGHDGRNGEGCSANVEQQQHTTNHRRAEACEGGPGTDAAAAALVPIFVSPRTFDTVQRAKGSLQRSMEALFYLEQSLFALNMTAKAFTDLHSDARPRPLRDAASSSRSSSSSSSSSTRTRRRADGRNVDDPEDRDDAHGEEEEDEQRDRLSLAASAARFVGIDKEAKLSSTQQLILYVLDVVYARGYGRCGADCYARRMTKSRGGFDTRAWSRVCSIKDLIYDATRKEIKFDQWLNLTQNRSNAQTVVDYMTNCSDAQFPVIHKDRHVFSFRNGIYVTSVGAIVDTPNLSDDRSAGTERVPDPNDKDEARRQLRDAFIQYGSREYAELPAHITAAKYFDTVFPAHLCSVAAGGNDDGGDMDWYRAIPTPHLQSIMDYQRFDEDVCRWMYVMIGRMLYLIGEYDGWQVVPYLKGQASSGKSTIVNMCRNMFECCDVGVLSNNIERKFGISALSDKYLFVAPEIKSDLQLEQAEFQSMVSGEPVQVNVKFQQARTVEWRVPGIMAGNEVPGWVDNAGSIGRRIVIFEFMRKVVDGDMELKYKLEREMPYILLKANRAYHEAVKRCGSDNLWVHLPDYFKTMQEDLTSSTNPIHHFMNSGKLKIDKDDPDLYMPVDRLRQALKAHFDELRVKDAPRLQKDVLKHVMYQFSLIFEHKPHDVARVYPRNSTRVERHREWCLGADLADDAYPVGMTRAEADNIFNDPMLCS